jgi:hypothetical protein
MMIEDWIGQTFAVAWICTCLMSLSICLSVARPSKFGANFHRTSRHCCHFSGQTKILNVTFNDIKSGYCRIRLPKLTGCPLTATAFTSRAARAGSADHNITMSIHH